MTDLDQLIAQSGIEDQESLDLVKAELEKSLGDSIDNAIYKGQRDQEYRRQHGKVEAEVTRLTDELEGLVGVNASNASTKDPLGLARSKEIRDELARLDREMITIESRLKK